MTPLLRKLLGMNWLIFLLMIALAVFGVVAIYSCTYMREAAAYSTMWRKQAVWIGISTIIFFVISLVDYRWIRWGALPMYLSSLVFLVLTLVIGKKLDGARCWLHVGPVQFQPAQLAVVSGIMVMALFLSQFRCVAPDAQVAGLRRDHRRSGAAHSHSARPGRMPHLDSRSVRHALHRAHPQALFAGLSVDGGHLHAVRLFLQAQALPAGAHHGLPRPGDRQAGKRVGHQPDPDRRRLRRLGRERLQGSQFPGRARLRSADNRAQRLHFLGHRGAMGVRRRRSRCWAPLGCCC